MTKLVALCEVAYGGKTAHAGDSFECDNAEDIKILVGLDKARLEDSPPVPDEPAAVYNTQALKAEPPPAKPQPEPMTADTALTRPKRVYKRRDMRAER